VKFKSVAGGIRVSLDQSPNWFAWFGLNYRRKLRHEEVLSGSGRLPVHASGPATAINRLFLSNMEN